MKIATYARVSTRDKGQDPENQARLLREFARSQGWRIVREYTDQASGKSAERDEFREMMEAAARREFDAVLCWALDRFTREGVAETFAHVARLRSYGVEFVSYTEAHFRTTGPAGELMIAIAAWIAKQERERLAARIQAAMDRIKATGKTKSGRPVGRPPLVFDRARARDLVASGMSKRKAAAELGIPLSVLLRGLR